MKAALNNLAGAGLPALGVKRPWLVTVMNLLIAIAGFVAIFAIEVRELPDVDQPVVNVRANFPGASPETMDSEVTRILEGAVARVSGVKEVNSNSEEGSSRIRAVFNPNSSVDRAAADVREAVSRVQRQLPENVEQLAVFKSDEDAEEIMRIAVLADGVTEQDLAKIVERDVVPAFISLPGVADVPLFGSRRQILRVELDPGRMSTYGLTVTDIRSVLSQAPLDVPAGSFKTNDQTLLVRADAAVDSEEDIGNLLITDKIRLRDVARVAYTPDDATSVVRLNGQKVLGVGVVRQAGSNTIQISEGARKAIAQFNAQRDDIRLQVISDEAVFINGAVSEVVRTLGFAVIIVILTIRLFSGSWRFTIVPAIAIPISLLGTLAASWALGFSINILTLLALVLATGLIVDDAIVGP
jgi:multidrug efflux pump subunit AcrB